MPDHGGALAHADEPCTAVSVHHGLIRLKGAGRAEPQLQELRAGDRVQGCRGIHPRQVRWRSPSSFSTRARVRQLDDLIWRADAASRISDFLP